MKNIVNIQAQPVVVPQVVDQDPDTSTVICMFT